MEKRPKLKLDPHWLKLLTPPQRQETRRAFPQLLLRYVYPIEQLRKDIEWDQAALWAWRQGPISEASRHTVYNLEQRIIGMSAMLLALGQCVAFTIEGRKLVETQCTL